MPNQCAAAPNPAGALQLQSTRPAGRVVELGPLDDTTKRELCMKSS